jgi:hypothetical protein
VDIGSKRSYLCVLERCSARIGGTKILEDVGRIGIYAADTWAENVRRKKRRRGVKVGVISTYNGGRHAKSDDGQ